jgi:hypothetical protein
VLILPPDHQRTEVSMRALTRRERRLIAVIGAVAAALVIAVIVSLAATGRDSGHGCIHAVYPGPVGAEEVYRCGAGARALCASLGSTPGYSGEARRTIAAACRKAGLGATTG